MPSPVHLPRAFASLPSLLTPLLTIIPPVFGLIFAGYACRKLNKLGPGAASELNRFVVYLALPALLFDIMAKTPWRMLDQPAFIAAFGIGSAVILSALPTGTGPFMLAEFYRREGGVTSSTILFSTVISLVTVTICLTAML